MAASTQPRADARPIDTPAAWATRRLVLHCPDITLKGRNQGRFQAALCRNVSHRLRRAGHAWRVCAARGRVYVEAGEAPDPEVERAAALMQEVPGVSSVGAAHWLRPREVRTGDALAWSHLEALVVDLARRTFVPGASFAVRVNRVDTTLPETSQDMERRLGAAIRTHTHWDKVNLRRPDRTFHIDAYPDGLYVYADKRPGVGGLPVGTTGRVLCLLSGGIDSPVAAYMLAKRGAGIDFLHFSASHVAPEAVAASVVGRLAARLSSFALRSRLFVAPYTHFDLALAGGERSGYELLLFRRFMVRVAEALAPRIGAQALVTGDSLGQVASQTLENLVSTGAAGGLLALRPLIGLNKTEIIEVARRIGTYEIAIEPYKDCCALLAPHPRTRSRPQVVARLEAERLPRYEALVEATLADMCELAYDCGERV